MKNKLNLSTLATKLTHNKWLLDSTTYVNLVNTVNSYIANPTHIQNMLGEVAPFVLEGSINQDEESGLTAIINVGGILVKGASPDDEAALGLVNTDFISETIDQCLADETVKDIVINFNSPGGETTGIEELARKICAADKIKPIYGWTENMACSAAYWLISQCRCIGMSPSACIGNVGVYTIIEDYSKQLESQGITIDAISAGKYKLLGASFKPMTPEERDILQQDITKQHIKFKECILSKRAIEDSYLEGLSYEGDQALEANLVDVVVDDLSSYLTTIESYNINNMKNFTKMTKKAAEMIAPKIAMVSETSPVQAEVVATKAVASEVTPVKAEVIPVKAEETPEAPCCPYCKGSGKYTEDTDDKEVEMKAEAAIPQAVASEVKAEIVAEVKAEVVAPVKAEDAWAQIFGFKKKENSFLKAAYDFVSQNKLN